MKALTVRQPWAWAIVHGGKDVENRTRNIAGTYRGPVAIHAGLREDDGQWPTVLLRTVMQADMLPGVRRRDDVRGAIIGVVDLADVHHGWSDMAMNGSGPDCCHSPWAELADPIEEDEGRGVWHLVLANPRPLAEPIYCRGALGLWKPPVEVSVAAAARC